MQKILRKLKERRMGILITDHNVRETLNWWTAYIIHKGDVCCEGEAEFLVNDATHEKSILAPSSIYSMATKKKRSARRSPPSGSSRSRLNI
ncbi:MAG: hypothetical protein CM1200mP29_14760 [Verrucomicrobiota bacterium]|nr:MAG: hypothetical protein CM1200mP29_14760 [Verrucomicrobiota bacterium]